MLLIILLVLMFGSSSNLAAAYGIAVTGAMFVDTLLAFVIIRKFWRWGWPATLALLVELGDGAVLVLASTGPADSWPPSEPHAASVAVTSTMRVLMARCFFTGDAPGGRCMSGCSFPGCPRQKPRTSMGWTGESPTLRYHQPMRNLLLLDQPR